jgi:hypothetical protein
MVTPKAGTICVFPEPYCNTVISEPTGNATAAFVGIVTVLATLALISIVFDLSVKTST